MTTVSTGFEKIGSDTRLQEHWIRRLIAFIIDSIIVAIATFIIVAVIAIPFIIVEMLTGLPWFLSNPFAFPFFVGILSILYFALLESWYGWTFGKRIMNLKVVKTDGRKPPLDATLIRNVSKIYWILVLLDVILGLATPGDPNQKITDRIAGTTVTSTTALPSSPSPPPPPTS